MHGQKTRPPLRAWLNNEFGVNTRTLPIAIRGASLSRLSDPTRQPRVSIESRPYDRSADMAPYDDDSVSIEDDDELTNEIVGQVKEWSSNSNECLTIRLLREDGSVASAFQPEFTYPMFGEEEAIFGYQDLEITLSFTAHDLQPRLSFEYGKIFDAHGDVKPTDIHEAMKDFLPEHAFTSTKTTSTAGTFHPPGERIHRYSRSGTNYEIWCASLADRKAKELLTNMQVLVPMFIEGGSTLELEQDWTTARWKLFLIYEVDQAPRGKNSAYTLAGFGTSYRIFTFPDRQTLQTSSKDDASTLR